MIIELLGLPGVGKTFYLKTLSVQDSKKVFADSGLSFQKLTITFYGLLKYPFISTLLLILYIYNFRFKQLYTYSRPYFVLTYRLAINYSFTRKNEIFLLDEGVYQFVWRVFCELRLSKFNLIFLNAILARLYLIGIKVFFLSADRNIHLKRVLGRKKVQNFDINFISFNNNYYIKSRKVIRLIYKILHRQNRLVVELHDNKIYS